MSDLDAQPSRPALTRDFILRRALAIIDRDGLDALTMRKLGAELGVDPMTVYRYVPNKGALLDGVAEVLWDAGLDLDRVAEGTSWRALVEQAMLRFRATLLAHPRAVLVVATHPLVTDRQLEFLERALQLLERGGLDLGPTALALLNVVATYTMGHVLAEAVEPAGGAGGELSAERIDAMRSGYPHLARILVTDGVVQYDPDAQYRRGLRAVLDGWEQ